MLFGAFQPPSPDLAGPPRSFPGAENQELASILLCPAPTSTFLAAIRARFTLASPATCISVSCNIRRARGKVSLRPMAASACSTLKATKIFAQLSLGKTTQRLAARKEAQPHSHDQSRVQRPCTDLGMEDDYSARKDVPVTIKFVSHQILFSGFGGREAPNSVGKISTAEVLRLRATSAASRNQPVRRSAQDDDSVGV
jgi:hypothetical protein